MKAFIVLLLLLPSTLFSQQQEIKVFSHNIFFGGLTGGIGAAVNRKNGESWKRNFIRGFWQGSVGGVLNYGSKKSLSLIEKKNNLGYAVPARIINAAGNSIIQNAASNGSFLKNWNLEYGFLRVDFSLSSQTNFRLRILPASLISAAFALPSGQLDRKSSLLTGMIVVRKKDLINTLHGTHDGINYGRAFIYYGNSPRPLHIISHEIIHEYQYREFLVINSYFKKGVSKLKENGLKKFVTKYIYPDVPYFGLFYMFEQTEPGPHFFRNYYEFEAERCALNGHVPLN